MSRAQPSCTTLSAAVRSGAKCAYCGTREDLVAHHTMPRRYGVLDRIENLAPVCRSCHPRVEQKAAERAEQVWEQPDWPELARRRRAPRPLRPY